MKLMSIIIACLGKEAYQHSLPCDCLAPTFDRGFRYPAANWRDCR